LICLEWFQTNRNAPSRNAKERPTLTNKSTAVFSTLFFIAGLIAVLHASLSSVYIELFVGVVLLLIGIALERIYGRKVEEKVAQSLKDLRTFTKIPVHGCLFTIFAAVSLLALAIVFDQLSKILPQSFGSLLGWESPIGTWLRVLIVIALGTPGGWVGSMIIGLAPGEFFGIILVIIIVFVLLILIMGGLNKVLTRLLWFPVEFGFWDTFWEGLKILVGIIVVIGVTDYILGLILSSSGAAQAIIAIINWFLGGLILFVVARQSKASI